MAHATDVVGHTYRADLYCSRCIILELVKRAELSPAAYDLPPSDVLKDAAEAHGIDWADERSFDSDEWPKVVFRSSLEDEGEHCGTCGVDLRDASSLDYDTPAGWPNWARRTD
jgi:hypothetical protein